MRTFIQLLAHSTIAASAALNFRRDNTSEPYSLPSKDGNITTRASALELKHAGWTYGPPKAGNTSFYPSGALGSPAALQQAIELNNFQTFVSANVSADSNETAAAITAAGGLNSLEDYNILYDGQWKRSVPKGPFPGMLTNYTNDLLFSMESLSLNPFRIVRVAADATLPFTLNSSSSYSSNSLETLQSEGRLFLSDFLNQKDLPTSAGKYQAATQAYFYIDASSGDFLPLAIKVHTDTSALVYTPNDSPTDWLMAKMLFNMNNFGHAEWFHLGATHALTEIVYLAAIRTLSDEHPVMALLHRVMKEAFAIRVAAEQRLLYPGGPIDSLFAYGAAGASQYTTTLYQNGEASAFQANYFRTNLRSRGLIDSAFGPPLKHFPFYEDAAVIHDAIHEFMDTFVNSYYEDENSLTADGELQSWIKEASGPAQVIDFPSSPLSSIDSLVDILTHIAHVVSVVHGTLNTNTPVASDASLPFHPSAFWSPIPTSKNITDSDLMKLMPQVQASIGQIVLLAAFNRPSFRGSGETVVHMFDDGGMLGRMNGETRGAEEKFRKSMEDFSNEVGGRKFDENGLCRGMPFIWGSLDPGVASYWLTI